MCDRKKKYNTATASKAALANHPRIKSIIQYFIISLWEACMYSVHVCLYVWMMHTVTFSKFSYHRCSHTFYAFFSQYLYHEPTLYILFLWCTSTHTHKYKWNRHFKAQSNSSNYEYVNKYFRCCHIECVQLKLNAMYCRVYIIHCGSFGSIHKERLNRVWDYFNCVFSKYAPIILIKLLAHLQCTNRDS